jgi:hypothetical protein
VLTACAGVAKEYPKEAISTAEVLLRHAAVALLPPTPGSSSGSGSRLTDLLWDQVQQSRFLQQVPGLLDSQGRVLQERMAAGRPSASTSDTVAASLVGTVFHLFGRIDDLQPVFLPSAGQQCLVPAMQLSLLCLQHVSTALPKLGPQSWMENQLRSSWHGISDCTYAASQLLEESSSAHQEARAGTGLLAMLQGALQGQPPQPQRASRQTPPVPPVLRAEQTVQCCCLSALVWMLVQFLQTTDAAATPSSASGARTSSSSGSAAPEDRPWMLCSEHSCLLQETVGCLACWPPACLQHMAACCSSWGAAGRWGCGLLRSCGPQWNSRPPHRSLRQGSGGASWAPAPRQRLCLRQQPWTAP